MFRKLRIWKRILLGRRLNIVWGRFFWFVGICFILFFLVIKLMLDVEVLFGDIIWLVYVVCLVFLI